MFYNKTNEQSNKDLDSLRLIDVLGGCSFKRAKFEASMLLPGYGPHVSELSNIFGIEVSCDGSSAKICIRSEESKVLERLVYNFDFIIKGLRGTLEVLHDYDEKFYLKFSTKQMFSFFRSFWRLCLSVDSICENPLKVMKYFTVFPLASYMKNDVPKKPEGVDNPFLFTGKIRSYLKQRLVSHNKKNCKLWWSWLQGIKRSCKEAPTWVVESSLRAHKETLSKFRPVEDEEFFNDFCQKVDVLTREFQYKEQDELEISGSACWESKRGDGGAHNYILKYYNDLYYTTSEQGYSCPIWSETFLTKMSFSPTKGVVELRGLYSPSNRTLLHLVTEESREHSWESFVKRKKELGTDGWKWEFHHYNKCQVSAVLEPLKVRLITKGEAFPYYLARSMQKSMHSYLRQFEPFELIGTPLTPDHLYRLVEREKKNDLSGLFNEWVSGDYSAATDNLKSIYTRMAFESFVQLGDRFEMGDPVSNSLTRQALRSVIYDHEVHYGPQMVKINEELRKLEPNLTSLEPFLQQNGQLMGSVLSFPILNVCNFVSYWISIERYLGRPIKYWKSLPVLTNGDDILFRTNKEHYEIWKECVSEVGFELSVGKNYVHKNLLTVNSQLYRMSKDEFYEIKFFNTGLLCGNSKIQDGRSSSVQRKCKRGERESDDSPFSANYNVVISGADNPERAHKRFLHYNKEDVKKYTDNGRINLQLPYHLGGLNCKVPETCNYVTPGQQRVAGALTELMYQNSELPDITGFYSDNPVHAEITLHKRTLLKYHFGYGPLEEGQGIKEDISIKANNVSLVPEIGIKFRALEKRKFYELAKQARSHEVLEFREPIPICNYYPKPITLTIL